MAEKHDVAEGGGSAAERAERACIMNHGRKEKKNKKFYPSFPVVIVGWTLTVWWDGVGGEGKWEYK